MNLLQLRETAKEKVKGTGRKRIAVAPADDLNVLEGVKHAYDEGLVEPVLIGPQKVIMSTLKAVGLDKSCCEIITVPNIENAVVQAAGLAVEKEVDILIPGDISVPDFFHHLFRKSCSFKRRGDFLSLVGVMEHKNYEGLLLLSDVGLVPDPTVHQGIHIIKNAVHIARLLGKKTVRVALLAFEEEASPKSPTTIAESIISEFFHARADAPVIVEGPMRLDIALKRNAIPCIPIPGVEQGTADVLIANNIHAGNSMYKAMITLCGATSAPVVAGGRCPIALPSKSESPENILNAIALTVLDSDRK